MGVSQGLSTVSEGFQITLYLDLIVNGNLVPIGNGSRQIDVDNIAAEHDGRNLPLSLTRHRSHHREPTVMNLNTKSGVVQGIITLKRHKKAYPFSRIECF